MALISIGDLQVPALIAGAIDWFTPGAWLESRRIGGGLLGG